MLTNTSYLLDNASYITFNNGILEYHTKISAHENGRYGLSNGVRAIKFHIFSLYSTLNSFNSMWLLMYVNQFVLLFVLVELV